jgi:hypothetical protein
MLLDKIVKPHEASDTTRGQAAVCSTGLSYFAARVGERDLHLFVFTTLYRGSLPWKINHT